MCFIWMQLLSSRKKTGVVLASPELFTPPRTAQREGIRWGQAGPAASAPTESCFQITRRMESHGAAAYAPLVARTACRGYTPEAWVKAE